MAQTFTLIPLLPRGQRFSISLASVTYNLRVTWNDAEEGGYILDIGDAVGNILVAGIPLVTGADLLAQHVHLGIGGSLFVTTDRDTGDVPTFDGLGVTSNLYFVTGP